MIKLIIKNPNGSIETKILSHDSTFIPKAGQQFYFDNSDGSRKYTFNLADGEKSIELIFAGNAERLKFNLNGMADLIKQSDLVANENKKTVLGIMNDEDGLKELNQTALNDNFQGDKVISELKQLLDDTNNPDEKYQNGIIIDDFGALAEQLDAAAAGAGPLGQNSGATDDPIATVVNTYAVGLRGVGDTLDRSYPTVDLQGSTTDETPIPVYIVISGTTILSEGGTANYIIKLIDIDGNEVTVSQDTIVKIKFENITTQDDDTEYSNEQIVEVTIKAGSSSTTLDVKTLDDLFAEEDEDYKLTIDSIDSNEFDDLRIENFTSTTETNYSITAETTITDEPDDSDDKVFVQLLGDDSVIEADGAVLTHAIKLVDENGNAVNLPAGKTITLTLTYTPDGTDGTETEDFTSDSLQTTVTISGNGGSEYTITNTVVDDALAEDIESYTVTLTNVSDDNNYFEDLSVDATQTSAIGSIVDENTPPAQPQVSVDLEVDPNAEVLTGTANTSTVDVTITDESGNVIYTVTNVVVVNGVWDLTNDPVFTALTFNEDEDYTATVTGSLNGVEVTDTDTDDYSTTTPNEPSVSVDLEVDPGAEKLVGTTDDPTNSVDVTITDESGNVIYTGIASVNPDGTWDLSNDSAFTALEFNDEEEYTATAVATNTNGLTANDSDVDEYKEADTAYSLKLFAVVEIANPEYDAQTNPNVPETIKTYVDANTVVEGTNGTYVVLAVDENGTPLTTQPGGTITVTTGVDSDSNTEDAVRGSDYDSITDALNDTTGKVIATVGIEFTIDTLDDIYAEEDENFILTLQEDWSEASNYEVIEYDKTPVITTITDEPDDSDDKVFVQLLGDDSVIEADGAVLTHAIKLVDENGNAVNLPAGKTITLTLTYTPDGTDGTETEDFTSDSLQTTVTISGNGGSEYTITNTVVDDALAEDIESYTVTLTNVSDDNNYFEDLSVDATQTSAIGSIVDENTPPAQPQVSVDLEVDPNAEVLTGTANTSTVDVTITDESGNVIYTVTNVVVVNGVWDLTNDPVFTALTFNEDEDYTATVTGSLNGVEVTDTDTDDYSTTTPNEPSVSVDLEVDPGAEKLVGTTDDPTNSVDVTITDESGNVIYTGIASVNPDGTWDLSNDSAFTALEFNDEEEYTATAVATNTNGLTANDSDVDEYKEADTAYSLKLFAVVEIANPEYDAQTNPNVPETIKTYVDANTVVEGTNGTYVVLAVDENGTPLTTQPGGTITVTTGVDSDSNTEDAVRGSDYDSITDALNDTTGKVIATVGIEFTIDTLDDIYAEEDENFILTLQEDWSEASNYEVIEYDKTPVITTITDEPDDSDDKVFVQLLGDDSVIEADGAVLTHAIKLVDENGNAVNLPAGKTITLTLTYTPDGTDGTETEDFTSDSLQTTVTISGNGGSEYTITNTVVDDALAEDIESYTVTLTNVSDDNNYFEDLSVDATQTSAIGSIVDENTPPAQPQVSVDLEVDPNAEVLTGTANTSTVDVTITDESGNVIYTVTNVVVVNGVWDLTNDPVFTALTFNEDEDYTATVTGSLNGVEVTDTDTDDYSTTTPNEPSVSVDLEVDPGAEKLVGTTDDPTNSVDVTITDESGNVIYTGIASVNPDGTWDLSNDSAFTALEFNDEEEYTATAVATNTNGLTANDSDVDEYKEADTAYSLKLFAVVEIANPEYDAQTNPNVPETIKTYVDANTVVEGTNGTYVVLAVDENGTPLTTQPGGTITVTTGVDSDSNTEDAVRGSDYDSITDALNDTTGKVIATVGIEFTIDTLDDIYAEEDENFILTLQEDWSEASNYEVIEYDKTPVITTITDDGNHPITANDDTITVCFTSYEAQAFNGNNFTTGNLGDEDDIGDATLKWNSQNQQVVETDLGLGVYGNINNGTTGISDSLGIDDDETLVIKLSNPVEQAVFQINADVTDETVYGAWTLFDENGEQVSVNTFFEIDSSGMLILSATDVNGDPVSFQYVSFEGKNEDQTASDLGYYVQPYGVDSDLTDDSITINPTTGAISVTILVSTILANDTDSDGDNSSLEFDSIVINSAVGGTAVYNNDGTITFTKDVDFDGIPSFDYSITDSDGNGTSSATVTLSSDCSLVLRNPYFATEVGYENILAEDSVDTIDGIDDGLNSSGNVITDNNLTGTVTLVNGLVISNPIVLTYGTLTINEDGSFDYVVNNNTNEVESLNIGDSLTETFTYTLSDGTVETATIVIEGRDDAPIIQNITTADVNLNNDSSIKYTLDVDGDGVTDTLSQSALLAQDRGLIYEENNGNLQIDLGEGGRDVAIEYHGGNASYKNIFGYYQLDANGNPTNFVILYADAGDEDGDGSNFDKNMNVDLGVLQDLEGEIGFFIIPNGNSNSDMASAVSDILNNSNSTWTITADSTNHIVLTNGTETITATNTYYTDNNLSTDGRDHAIAGISEDGTGITIGFEDLPENSTDQDYDDFVFTIKYCDTTGDNGQLFTNVNFTDVDDANLTSATVTLNDAQVGDSLSVDLTKLPTGINAVINGNTITFTNVASLDDYEDAIEAIRFATTSSNRSTREFDIEISDGLKTDSITKTVNIIGCELETYSPVYIKIIETDSVTEGDVDNTLTHKVILVDAAGNPVTVPTGESITVTLNYTDGTGLTNDDFTTARQTTVTINGGESEATITNYVKDDAIDENTESYVVEIASIDNNPFDTDLINTGTSTTGTIIDNDTITITVDPDGAQVDEDFIPNIGNATDPDTDLVANQYTDSGNITTTGGVSDVIFATSQTTTLTSQGVEIILTTSADGKTITGTSGTTSIFTATISADGTSYDFVLQGNIDHPDMSSEDALSLSLKIEATNGTNTVDDTLTVTIADDIPCANDSSISISLDTTPVNLIFTLDISGSMDDDVANTNGKSKLDIAIEAIEDLVASYEAQGKTVNIQLTTFSTEATEATVWMNSTTLATALATLSANGWTNYEDALQTTVYNYENSTVPAGTTYAYFLSDGNPTVEMNDSTSTTNDITSGNHQDGVDGSYIDDAYIAQWNQFVTDNNISEVYAVGIGDDVSSNYLKEITDISNVIIVSEDNLVNLSATLLETVVYETGMLDFCFGADGAADGTDTKLDGDKLPFTWEVNNLPTSIVWTLSTDGTVLIGTINNETVIKVEATDIYTNSPKYVITQLSENIGIDNLSLEYTVTDGDGDSVTAELNIDINIPITYERDVITCEDRSYTFTLDDFDSSAASIRIDTLPINGTLYLDGDEVHIGDIISSSDIINGMLTFEPDLNESGRDKYYNDGTGDQQNDYAEFNFSVNDGTSWISVNSTMTIDVSPVADAPTLSVLGIVGETTTIDVTNVTDTSGGYSVSAYYADGTVASISIVSGTTHDGFGVQSYIPTSGDNPGAATEISYQPDSCSSESIVIKFDNEIGSVDISYAWKHSYDSGDGDGEIAIVQYYKDGVLLYTEEHYDPNQTDTVDGPYTFALSGGESFDEIRISAKQEGDDFLIHSVTFTEIETSTTQVNVETGNTFDFEISSSLFDTDGSESLVSIVIDNIPEGMILTDGTNTFTSTSSNDSVDVLSWDLDAIKITVPSDLTAGDYDLLITAKSQESLNGVITPADPTLCPLEAETSTTFKVIVSEIVDPVPTSISESQDMDVCLMDTNLVITLDVSGSMTNDNGWIDTNGDGVKDTTRLQLAKDAIIEMINKYSLSGTVMVQLTLFDSNAQTISFDSNAQTSSWMSATDAITYITAISAGYKDTVDYNQMTDYETAINITVNNYKALNNGAQTIAYFISDGSPTEEIDDGYKEEYGYLDSQYVTKWTNFVNSIDGVHAVGIGSGISNSAYLETMSVGTGAEYTDDLSIDSTLTNGIGDSVTGNLLDNITWGVDSNGNADVGTITSIIIDGVTYNATDYTDSYTFNTGQGEFEFNFITGDYTYTNTESDVNNDYSEVIYLKATDSTGDETTYNLTVNVTLGECTVSNPTPTNVILTDNEVVTTDNCHNTTITSVSTSYTVYDSDDIDLGKFVTDGAKNIDSISLEGNSTTDILKINLDDVVDLTDSDNELKIFGDDGDKVILEGGSASWVKNDLESNDDFNVYQGTGANSNIKVIIDTDIDPEI